jgi:hypothetical protein
MIKIHNSIKTNVIKKFNNGQKNKLKFKYSIRKCLSFLLGYRKIGISWEEFMIIIREIIYIFCPIISKLNKFISYHQEIQHTGKLLMNRKIYYKII